jgi:hypothetical protein
MTGQRPEQEEWQRHVVGEDGQIPGPATPGVAARIGPIR